MKKLYITFLLALLSFSVNAQNGPAWYYTIGGGLLTFDDGVDSIEPKQLVGRLGYDFNANFGVGIEGGFSLIEDDLMGVDFDVSTTFIFLKGSVPLSSGGKIFGMIGTTNTEITGSLGGFSVSADDDDTGMGIGFEAPNGFTVDYIIYNDNDGIDVTSINIGFTSYF